MHARTGEKANRVATGSSLKELGLEPRCRGPATPTTQDTSRLGFDGEHQIDRWFRGMVSVEDEDVVPGRCSAARGVARAGRDLAVVAEAAAEKIGRGVE
jgi:hypothetical protein